ncbi:unnamed protein product [Rotaria socialis]|uniref:Uncharacterized protein n=1 Tax=Rotaria socialis TaxID=392032 RepID=A0A818W5Q8_9BILA|nr:unnamed protein product [Rotaria socialis]CAF3720569.1 unnamed protein product [Rotaria socialis]CAF4659695.1 unnamed protein product [Rotaria socialis]CAF4697090.1 unnamed protein product [Rotaria socialis]
MTTIIAGFLLLKIRDKSKKKAELQGGVTQYTTIDATNTAARIGAGILTFGFSELAAGTVKEDHYFYGDEYLGASKNEAAVAANKKGLELCNKGNFAEAQKLFNAAFYTCENESSNEESYKNSRDAMAIAIQGQQLHNSGRYSEAIAKFDEAHTLSNVSEVCHKLKASCDAAQWAVGKKANEDLSATTIKEEPIESQAKPQNFIEQDAPAKVASKAASRWKLLAEKYAANPSAMTIVNRWKQIAEALMINEQGLKLYHEGKEKLKEAAEKIELALEKFEEAASKFTTAAMREPLDVIFNSFLMVIDAFIENQAYDEAQTTIDLARGHFPHKADAFAEAERMIKDDSWSPNYTQQFLVQLDQHSIENNIMELANPCEN